MWIDKKDYQWVKVDLESLDTITFGGFLLRLAKGSHVTVENTRVNNEVWLPKRVDIKGSVRVALVHVMRGEIIYTFSDYKKFQTDSRDRDSVAARPAHHDIQPLAARVPVQQRHAPGLHQCRRVRLADVLHREIVALIEILERAFDSPLVEAGGRAGEHERVHPFLAGGESADRVHPRANLVVVGQGFAPPQAQFVDIHGQPQGQEQSPAPRATPPPPDP